MVEEKIEEDVNWIIEKLKRYGNVEVLGIVGKNIGVTYSKKKIEEINDSENKAFYIRLTNGKKFSNGAMNIKNKRAINEIIKNLNNNTPVERNLTLPKRGKANVNLFDEELYNMNVDELIKIGKILNSTRFDSPGSSLSVSYSRAVYGNQREIKSFEKTMFNAEIEVKYKDTIMHNSNSDVHMLNVEKIREEAEEMARRYANRKEVKPQKIDVIFEKDALVSLISTLLYEFEAPMIYGGIDTIWKNMNKKFFTNKFTMRTDSNIEMSGSLGFDFEGNPTGNKYLVNNGKIVGILSGRFLGEIYKQKQIFNAGSLDIPTAIHHGNIIIERGNNSVDGDALLVNMAMGWHTADLSNGNVSISVANGLLQKERKEIPIKNGMISFNLFNALKNAEFDKKRERIENFFVPRIRIKNVQFVS